MIDRKIEPILKNLASQFPVVTVTGPRQSGKTTLCKKVFPDYAYVNLEAPDTRRFSEDDPRGFLSSYSSGVILDEIQRSPQLTSYIQTIVDDSNIPGQFILTGSQQFEVMNTINQSLAGRTALLKLLPFSLGELSGSSGLSSIDDYLLNGFYPRIHDKNLNPTQALGDYFETYVERDVRQLSSIRDISHFEKFVRLCAGRIGQPLNLNSLGNDAGVSHSGARSWLTLLEASYIIFLLQPWHANFSKRLIKAPKLYFYDVGLASFLLGIENRIQASRDPLRGNLFENMMIMEALKFRYNSGKRSNLYFYRDSNGAEVDLIADHGQTACAIEIKAGSTINSDFFKGLRHLRKLSVNTKEIKTGLLYGGSASERRNDVIIKGGIDCEKLFQELDL